MKRHARVLFGIATLCAVLLTAGVAQAAETYVPDGSFSGPGSDPGQVQDPKRAAVEQSTGNVFVADQGNGEVDVFKADGSYLTSFGASALDAPFGLAIRESGGQSTVYVSDGTVGKVQRFDSNEAATPAFTLDAGYAGPPAGAGPEVVGDFAAPLALAPNGDLWVADKGDDKLQRYTASGAFVASIDGATSPGGAFTGLLDLAVDSQGRVYAVDSDGLIENQPGETLADGQSRVERFAADGAHQLTLAALNRPATVAVDLATDNVAVSADQTAINNNESPSLHVFDSAGVEFVSTRMGAAAQYSTVQGLAFESAGPRIWSVNDNGYYLTLPYSQEQLLRFDAIEVEPPVLSVDAVGSPGHVSVQVSGAVDPRGLDTTYRFQYATQADFSDAVSGDEQGPIAGFGSQPVTDTLTGLTPDTQYYLRLSASSMGATTLSSSVTFTTDAVPPVAETMGTTDRDTATAYLKGRVNPMSLPTTYWFEWGTSPGVYPNVVPVSKDLTAGNGEELVPVEQQIAGLSPNTTYYYRLVAESGAGGVAHGEEHTVTTRSSVVDKGGVGVEGDRGIELVSLPRKSYYPVISGRLSDDGNRALYGVFGGTDLSTVGGGGALAAQRTESGWVSENVLPPKAGYPFSLWKPIAATPDLERVLWHGYPASGVNPPDRVVLTGPGGIEKAFTEFDPGAYPIAMVASNDLERVLGACTTGGCRPLTPDDPTPEGHNVYEFGPGGPSVVSRLPDGTVPTCGIGGEGFARGGSTRLGRQNWISDDGSRFFFETQGHDCFGPVNLYMREGAQTVLISKDEAGQAGGSDFIKASADGSQAFYASHSRLVSADQNDTRDVYRYTSGAGNQCVTCIVPRANVAREGNLPSVLVSEDGSRVYFISRSVLLPGYGTSGEANIYLVEGGGLSYVAPIDFPSNFAYDAARKTEMSPDGSVLLFTSAQSITAEETNGTRQIYRYDSRDHSLGCVSCHRGVDLGRDAWGELAFRAYVGEYGATRPMSADGSVVAFEAFSDLVPEDVNEDRDVYEWRDGQLALLSDGVTRGASPELSDVTPDGKSILFSSAAKLNEEVDEGEEPTAQMYVARIGGGFAPIPPPVPCAGDGCQGGPTPPPAGPSISTSSFAGPGNPKAKPVKPRCVKGKARRKGRCVKSKKSKTKRQAAKRAGAKRGGRS